jgi:hypothetical protein
MEKKLVFLCGARDFHAMDWYKSAKELLPQRDICILTDLIAGEGFKTLIDERDKVFKLFILDRFLLNKQSAFGNIWRNILKMLVFPRQVFLIKQFSRKNPDAIYHAHSMYYLFLAWAAGVEFVGTPQGSDILIKPYRSKLYRHYSIRSLKAAKAITVDSLKMKEKVWEIASVSSYVIQNGIDVDSINNFLSQNKNDFKERTELLSIRGFTPLYRILDIALARNSSKKFAKNSLIFIYPFYENVYMKEVLKSLKPCDFDYGRVNRLEMYDLLTRTKLVFSIPTSDSSPRSVYEAIFCGCAVAITYNSYYDLLPECMKSRIILVDLNDNNWFDIAVECSNKIIHDPYIPSNEALEIFDQRKSFRRMQNLLFT